MENFMRKGVIETWHDDKGFGFITTDDNQSVFFHISEYVPQGRPRAGETMLFELGEDKKGRLQAHNVQTQKHYQQAQHQNNFEAKQTQLLIFGCVFYVALIVLAAFSIIDWLVVCWYVALGLVTFAMYAKDKSAAQKGTWRTPEKTLHTLSLIGGWVGAMLAQSYLRHKSQKSRFRLVYYMTVFFNLIALTWFIVKTYSL